MLSQIDPERMSHKDLLAYCYSLEERLRVEAELADAQGVANLRKAFGLTAKEAALLAVFADGRVHSKENILLSLYFSSDDAPELKIVEVFICKIRAKLAGSAVVIDTQWGTGYFVKDAAPLRAVMAGGSPEPGEVYAARIGRPLAAPTAPIGAVPAAVAKVLRERCGKGGIIKIGMRELSAAVGHKCYGSSTIRAMEKSGWLKVLSAPPAGNNHAARWKIKLLPKAFERSA